MWKWLNSYAQPERAYQACNTLLPYFTFVACVFLPLGIIWGLAFAPTDYQQFDVYRIIYIHVPSATLSLSTYVAMATAAFVGIVWQWKSAFTTMLALAPIGVVITFISLFTGAVWGKPTWGTYWIWDARLTSQLILLFLYAGVIALYLSFDDKQQGAKTAAIVAIVGVINIPIIKYSVEWWNTLHQTATISKLDKPSMPAEMLFPLLSAMLGMAGFIATITVIRLKNELVKQDLHRPWVANVFEKEHMQTKPVVPLFCWVITVLAFCLCAFYMLNQGFKFASMDAFWDMGGRGIFVWTSFGVSLLLMSALLFFSIFERKKIIVQAQKQKARAQRIMAAREKKRAARNQST